MEIKQEIPLLESILSEWQALLGPEYMGYRNHVYRMLHFCFALKSCDETEVDKLVIAAAFHDIGIWIEDTLDYIPPSIPPAMEYLERHGLENWGSEVTLMISEHHKIRAFESNDYPLVELFRRADLVDFSKGIVRFGLPRSLIKEVKKAFPNEGFHKTLVRRSMAWLPKHPTKPAPMFKW